MKHTIFFKAIGETKGTGKYTETNEDGSESFSPKVGTLYVKKSAMVGGKIPQKLKVEIEEIA